MMNEIKGPRLVLQIDHWWLEVAQSFKIGAKTNMDD